jgi:hypothetical protein
VFLAVIVIGLTGLVLDYALAELKPLSLTAQLKFLAKSLEQLTII